MLVKNSSRFLVSFIVLKLKIIKNQNKVLVYLKLILSELIKNNILKMTTKYQKRARKQKNKDTASIQVGFVAMFFSIFQRFGELI